MQSKTTKRTRTDVAVAVLFWPVVLLLGLYLNNREGFHVGEEYKYWAFAHLALHGIPVFIHLIRKKSDTSSFPFMAMLALFNIVEYALPVFFIQLEDYQLGLLDVRALQETFYAYSIFYSSFYLFLFSGIKIKPIEFAPPETKTGILKIAGYLLLLAYLTGSMVKAIYHIGIVGFYIYIGIFIYLWRANSLKKLEKSVFLVFLFYDFVQRALDGLIAPFALLVAFIAICVMLSKSNRLVIVLSVVVFVWFYSIFSLVKFDYRYAVWYGNRGRTIVDKVMLIQELYSEKQLDRSASIINDYKGKDHFLWRFSYPLSAMSLVLIETPARVPYWNGDTYITIFSKFIPRFMWPGKPQEEMGYRFGTTYRVMSTWNRTTSLNTPILPELYMNFGFAGLYIGSFLLGLLFFILSRLFNSNRVSYVSRIVGMAIIFPLITWESNFSLTYGNLFLITIVLVLLFRFLPRFVK